MNTTNDINFDDLFTFDSPPLGYPVQLEVQEPHVQDSLHRDLNDPLLLGPYQRTSSFDEFPTHLPSRHHILAEIFDILPRYWAEFEYSLDQLHAWLNTVSGVRGVERTVMWEPRGTVNVIIWQTFTTHRAQRLAHRHPHYQTFLSSTSSYYANPRQLVDEHSTIYELALSASSFSSPSLSSSSSSSSSSNSISSFPSPYTTSPAGRTSPLDLSDSPPGSSDEERPLRSTGWAEELRAMDSMWSKPRNLMAPSPNATVTGPVAPGAVTLDMLLW